MNYRWNIICLLLTACCAVRPLAAADGKKEGVVLPNYDDQIKPILRQHCLKCHGEDKQEADINLQVYTSLLRGGSSGKIVVTGRSAKSLLFQAITNADKDERMPPDSPPLSAAKIAMIRKWIDTGLRESAGGKSILKARRFQFQPAANSGSKPEGSPAMPANLPEIQTLPVKRPLPILAMDTSPWAPLLAVSAQGCVRLIHTETEKELGRLAFSEGVPHVIRFSRDGSVLMVAGGRPVESGRVVLFDVRTGKRLAEIGDEIDAVLAADLSGDQRLVAMGGTGRVVKVYATTSGRLRYKITRHTDWVMAVGFSPDGLKLATADRAGRIYLWNAQTGRLLLSLAGHKEAVRAIDWRADSKILASMGEDGRLIWWDASGGFPAISKADAHLPRRPAGVYGHIPNGVLAGRFDREGNLVTAGRDRVVRLWDSSGNQKKSFKIGFGIPISCCIVNGGKTVISGDSRGIVRFWKSASQ